MLFYESDFPGEHYLLTFLLDSVSNAFGFNGTDLILQSRILSLRYIVSCRFDARRLQPSTLISDEHGGKTIFIKTI